MKNVLAALVAFVVGGIVVAVVQTFGAVIHPIPEGVRLDDADALKTHAEAAPLAAKLVVVLAWALGGLAAGFVARFLAAKHALLPGCIVLGVFTVAVVVQLVTIPSPLWMWVAGIISFPVMGLVGMSLVPGCNHNVTTTRQISASLPVVFEVIASPSGFQAAVPGIQDVEFLSEVQSGVGTRFVETRIMNGREAKAELEVTELTENESVRIVSDMGGTVWDTVFQVRPNDGVTELTMSMDARPHNPFASLVTPCILPMVAKAVESDMDAVKDHCESLSTQ